MIAAEEVKGGGGVDGVMEVIYEEGGGRLDIGYLFLVFYVVTLYISIYLPICLSP